MADRLDLFHKYEIKDYIKDLKTQLIYQVDNYLFSHSGVLPKWLEINKLKLKDLENLKFEDKSLADVSPYRGGYSEVGSCIWGDVREYDANEHIPGIYQIFGHTQLKNAIIKDDYACLDCRKAFILEDGKLREYE